MGIGLTHVFLGGLVIGVRNNPETAAFRGYGKERDHALNAVEARFSKGVLITVYWFDIGHPGVGVVEIIPPRSPEDKSVHTNGKILSLPNRRKGIFHTRQTAQIPSRLNLASSVRCGKSRRKRPGPILIGPSFLDRFF